MPRPCHPCYSVHRLAAISGFRDQAGPSRVVQPAAGAGPVAAAKTLTEPNSRTRSRPATLGAGPGNGLRGVVQGHNLPPSDGRIASLPRLVTPTAAAGILSVQRIGQRVGGCSQDHGGGRLVRRQAGRGRVRRGAIEGGRPLLRSPPLRPTAGPRSGFLASLAVGFGSAGDGGSLETAVVSAARPGVSAAMRQFSHRAHSASACEYIVPPSSENQPSGPMRETRTEAPPPPGRGTGQPGAYCRGRSTAAWPSRLRRSPL